MTTFSHSLRTDKDWRALSREARDRKPLTAAQLNHVYEQAPAIIRKHLLQMVEDEDVPASQRKMVMGAMHLWLLGKIHAALGFLSADSEAPETLGALGDKLFPLVTQMQEEFFLHDRTAGSIFFLCRDLLRQTETFRPQHSRFCGSPLSAQDINLLRDNIAARCRYVTLEIPANLGLNEEQRSYVHQQAPKLLEQHLKQALRPELNKFPETSESLAFFLHAKDYKPIFSAEKGLQNIDIGTLATLNQTLGEYYTKIGNVLIDQAKEKNCDVVSRLH